METKYNTFCPKCSKIYTIFRLFPLDGCVPLLLPCSHSVCEFCVRVAVQSLEPLVCRLCERRIELTPAQIETVLKGDHAWNAFPIDVCMFGELCLQIALPGNRLRPRTVYPPELVCPNALLPTRGVTAAELPPAVPWPVYQPELGCAYSLLPTYGVTTAKLPLAPPRPVYPPELGRGYGLLPTSGVTAAELPSAPPQPVYPPELGRGYALLRTRDFTASELPSAPPQPVYPPELGCGYALLPMHYQSLNFDHPNSSVQNKTPKERKRLNCKPKPVKTIDLTQSLVKKEYVNEDLLVESDNGPVKQEVKVLSCQTPSQLYLSLSTYENKLDILFTDLQIHYDNALSKTPNDWKPKDRCCVIHKMSKTWRRAVILHIEEEKAGIFYTDFAVVEEVKLSELRELAEDFTKIEDRALKCHLSGIIPVEGSKWAGISCEYLNLNVEKYQRFFITIKGNIKDNSIPVELWGHRRTPDSALDPDSYELQSLNDQLLRQGLALPDKEGDDESQADNTPYQLPTAAEGERLEYSDSERASLESPAAPTAPAWLPAEPLTEDSFEAIPTFVDNDGCIYLHNVCHEDTLDVICSSLREHFKDGNSQPSPNQSCWSVGDSCMALHGLDNRCYRGSVLKIKDESTCLVHFVDYGNSEICNIKNMRKEMGHELIPILATRCCIIGIKFVEGKKRLEAIKYTRKLIVNKRCSVQLVYSSEDVHRIEMNIDNENIGCLLVKNKFAIHVNAVSSLSSLYGNRSYDEDQSSEDIGIVPGSLRYRPAEVPGDSFKCTITSVERFTQLQLLITQNNEQEKAALVAVLEEVRAGGEQQPPLACITRQQACVARYGHDGEWRRATVLYQDRPRSQVKVFYVDLGKTECVAAKDVRESHPRWCEPPACAIAARLHGVHATGGAIAAAALSAVAASGTGRAELTPAFHRILLLEREVHATVMPCARAASMLQVELRVEPGGPLLYQPLIDKGLLRYAP